jgi:GT2 family glycosyltransferase
MIPTYNCAHHLPAALAGVLAQDPGPDEMQIEVVDDASDDDPESVVAELGGGRVGFFRQPKNVGHTANFDTCLRRARGFLVHQLHGDDAVLQGFYERLGAAFASHPEVGAAFTRHVLIDEDGHWQHITALERRGAGMLDGWLDRIAVEQRLQTPSIAVRRSVYEELGSFDQRLRVTEDWEMWVRVAAHYPVWYEPEILALYRMTAESHSKRTFRTGENVRDLRRAIAVNRESLTSDAGDRLTRRALRAAGRTAVRRGHELLAAGDPAAATRQGLEALRTSRSRDVAVPGARLLARAARARIGSQ